MIIVVDASVLVAAAVDNGDGGAWAEQLLAQSTLTAPSLVFAEVANALRQLERAKKVTSLEATAAREDIERLDLELFPFAPLASRIWELRVNVSPYDAWYVAVAEALDLPLATIDRRLSRATGPTCRFLLPS